MFSSHTGQGAEILLLMSPWSTPLPSLDSKHLLLHLEILLRWQSQVNAATLDACFNEGIIFIPLPIETLGGMHKTTVVELKKIARAQARAKGQEDDEAIRHFFQRMSVLFFQPESLPLTILQLMAFSKTDISL